LQDFTAERCSKGYREI